MILEAVHPDKIQLNTVVRPPAEKDALPLKARELREIEKTLGGVCEAAKGTPKKNNSLAGKNIEPAILEMVRRRPVTEDDISSSLGKSSRDVRDALERLIARRKIRAKKHGGREFYEPLSIP